VYGRILRHKFALDTRAQDYDRFSYIPPLICAHLHSIQ